MPMLKDPSLKYKKFPALSLPNRQWPSKSLDKPPRWLSTDLRDGNQSLANPMDGDQKFEYFQLLVELGYKEIEVSFPSASDTDFNFVRRLVETPGTVPDDVWLQVLSPCRTEHIYTTVQSLKGTKKAILHIYQAASECFQRIVFNLTAEESLERAVKCTEYARSITKDNPEMAGTDWAFEYSPENFSDSDPEYIIRVCEAVKAAWEPSVENPIIFNLPATVEMSTPNVYADQIEYFCTHISEREKVSVSLHPHNDRGCAVAAAELAQMAGADRVEGCLFGNGERTGNVDLVTLALNLYTQGIHPNIDFSDIQRVVQTVEKFTEIEVHKRAPYGGELVVCAFSGSHQDAIKKGFNVREKAGATDDDTWEMPYLPLDPKDIGRTYEAVIRVNSQSGKGGAAYIIEKELGLKLPRGLQIAFQRIVQRFADEVGRELLPQEISDLFEKTYYLKENPRLVLIDYSLSSALAAGKFVDTKNSRLSFSGIVAIDGVEHKLHGTGVGSVAAIANSLRAVGIELDVADYEEHAIGKGRDVKAASYVVCTAASSDVKVWGVGIHEDTTQSHLIALLSAASSFVSSRSGTPIQFKENVHNSSISEADDLGKHGVATPKAVNGASGRNGFVSNLEAHVNGH